MADAWNHGTSLEDRWRRFRFLEPLIAYGPNADSNTVSVINGSTNTVDKIKWPDLLDPAVP